MPIVGTLLDNFTTQTVLGVLVIVSTVTGILQVTPNLIAQYVTVLIFAIYRPLYYTSVSDYCAKIFGFRTFGKVYGISNFYHSNRRRHDLHCRNIQFSPRSAGSSGKWGYFQRQSSPGGPRPSNVLCPSRDSHLDIRRSSIPPTSEPQSHYITQLIKSI